MQRPPTIPQCMYQTNIHKKIYWWKLNPYRIYKYICISYIAQEKFEDTNDVIRIGKSKKHRQYNGQKKKDKRTKNDK
jgi:hypothetical protein